MAELVTVTWTLHLAPATLAFIREQALRSTAELHRVHPEIHEVIDAQTVAAMLLDQAIEALQDAGGHVSVAETSAIPNQEDIDQGTAARVKELLSEGHADLAHELMKTIETPEIRDEVGPEA